MAIQHFRFMISSPFVKLSYLYIWRIWVLSVLLCLGSSGSNIVHGHIASYSVRHRIFPAVSLCQDQFAQTRIERKRLSCVCAQMHMCRCQSGRPLAMFDHCLVWDSAALSLTVAANSVFVHSNELSLDYNFHVELSSRGIWVLRLSVVWNWSADSVQIVFSVLIV